MSLSIREVWEFFDDTTVPVREIRAFHYADKSKVQRRVFIPGAFDSIDDLKLAIEKFAMNLNSQGYNIYTTLNPIIPTFTGSSASDEDIACRELLLIDIDRTGDTKSPATDAEVSAATSLADTIETFLTELGWPKPVRLMSGNGHHLYYPLASLPNNAESTSLIRRVLNCLADKFDRPEVAVDRVVYNASRITKVPGTIMRKGEESGVRPYRRAVLYEN
jgi:hypothetical protein